MGPVMDSDRPAVTFLWASDPPYWIAMSSPIDTYTAMQNQKCKNLEISLLATVAIVALTVNENTDNG